MSPEEDVLSESSSSETDNLTENKVICNLCKKSVKNRVQCKKCKTVFHPSCMVNANKQQNRTCTHEVADRQDILEKVMLEIKYLKKIKREQEERIETLKENNKLLEENNKLLKENYELLHEKIEALTTKSAKPYSSVVRSEVALGTGVNNSNQTSEQPTRIDKETTKKSAHEKRTRKNAQPAAAVFLRQEPSTSVGSKQNNENTQKNSIENESEEWQVKNKRNVHANRNKKPLFYGTSEDTSNVKGIPRKTWFFVSRLDPQMSEEELKGAIKTKCIDHPNVDIVVEKKDVFHKFQSAFKVGLPLQLQEQARNPSFWPLDSKVNTFNFFLQRSRENTNR